MFTRVELLVHASFAHCNTVYKNDGETIEYATIER